MKIVSLIAAATLCTLFTPAFAQTTTLTTQDVQKRRESDPALTDRKESYTTDKGRVLVIHKSQPLLPADATTADSQPHRIARTPSATAVQQAELGERLQAAREKIRDLFSRADQAELESGRVRNRLFSAETRDPEENGKMLQRIGELQNQARQLRAQASAARDEEAKLAAQLEDLGIDSNADFTDTSGLSPAQMYRLRFDRLQSSLRDTQARTDVIQRRINEIVKQIRIQAGNADPATGATSGGDNFYRGQLLTQLQEERAELQRLQSHAELLRSRISDLLEQARRDGIAPGLFR